MINVCIQHLETVLEGIGFKEILTQEEEIDKFKGSRFAGLAINEARLTKDGIRVGVEDDLETMKRTYRYRLYKLEIPLIILLADKNRNLVNTHLMNFLSGLGTYIKDTDQNPIEITGGNPQWLEDKSLLNQRTGIELPIVFTGGVYKDKEITLIPLETALEIETEIGGVTDDNE